MSYDGNGGYDLPAPEYPAIPGTTILAEDFNTIVEDIKAALSLVLARDGQAPMTGDLDLGSNGILAIATLAGVVAGMQLTNVASIDALAAGGVLSGSWDFPDDVTAPTQPLGTNTNQVATMAALVQAAFNAALPALPNDGNSYVTKELNNSVSWSRLKTVGGSSLFGTGDIQTVPDQTGNSGKFLKTNGVATSWDYAGISTVGATVTGNYTIVSVTPTIWPCATTAIGKSITAPDATTCAKGLFAVIDNKAGGYPVGYRDSTGTLIAAVAPGGVAHIYLEDTSTAAGTWRVTGTNLEAGLVTIDNTFSSTYLTTVFKPFVALDSNKSIHFLELSSGFAAVAVDNTTGAVGTPVTVDATASSVPKAAFKIDSTHAMVFYGATNNTLYGVVLTLSGATNLAVGTADNSGANTGIAVEDFSSEPKIAQLDTNLFLVSWATATGAGNTSVMGVQVSSSVTVKFGAKADIITTNNCQNSTQTYKLTTLTGAVLYKDGAAAPYNNKCCVVSVTNANPPVCTVSASDTATSCGSSQTAACSSVLISATKIAIADDNNTTQVTVSGFTFAGTATTKWTALNVETGLATNLIEYTTNNATRYNPHLWLLSAGSTNTFGCWYGASNVSRVVVLSETGGTVTAGTKHYRSIFSGAANAAGAGAIQMQGTTEFVSIRQSLADSAGYGLSLNPCKISGSTITQGAGITLPDLTPDRSDTGIAFTRLSSGIYVLTQRSVGASTNTPTYPKLPVFSSNGDFINYRGSIAAPSFANGGSSLNSAVSSNRIVIIGGTNAGTTVSASTVQSRLLSVEICA